MKLIAAFTVIVLATYCNAASDCEWGPAYWCQSKTTAQQCGQEKYCMEKVWKMKEVSVSGGAECTICKIVVEEVGKYVVDSNKTKSDAENALEDLCSALGPFSSECIDLVTQFFPQIWELLVDETDPDKVCSEIGLCSSSKRWKQTAKDLSVSDGVGCSVCKLVVGKIDDYIDDNKTEDEVKQEIESFCSALGVFGSECKSLVEKYFPQIWELLEKETDPDTVCSLIGLCSSTTEPKPKNLAVNVRSVQCDVCELLVKQVENLVLNNATEEKVQQELDDLCSKLGSLGDECKTFVDDYLPDVWKAISNGDVPDVICTAVGLCKNATVQKTSMIKSVQCDVCEMVIKFVENDFLNNKSENAAQQALDNVCSKLGSLGDECKVIVDKYFPEIWDMLVKNADPDTICTAIGLCKSKVASIKLPIECEMCDVVVKELEDLILNNSTEGEAKAEVEKVCNYLGGFASQCKSLIDDNWDTLWSLLSKEIDPKTVCETVFSQCKNQTKFLNAVVSKLKSNSTIPCALCELTVPFLQYAVDEDSDDVQSDLITIISEICEYFPRQPKNYVKECTDWVNTYVPIIWRRYKDEIDHDEVCKDLNLCPTLKKKKQLAPRPVLKAMPQQNLCDLCKLVATFLKNFVDNNSTEQEVKKSLEGLCGLLPGNSSSQCTKLVDDNFDLIWDLVKKEVDSGEICKQLGVCNSTLSFAVSAPKPKALPTADACDLCKLAAQFLKPYVDNNATEQQVQAAMDSLCKLLPSSLSDQCKTFADDYLKNIWQSVQKEVDSGKLCTDLDLCTNSSKLTVKLREEVGDDSIYCFLCYLGDAFLKGFINNSTNENDVIGGFQKICVILPPNVTNQCIDFVRGYIPKIWKLMQLEINSGQLCYDITACANKSLTTVVTEAAAAVSKPKLRGPACDICKLLISYLKPFADNKTAEDKAVQAVKNFCTDLPDNYSKECQAQADKYVRQIWDDIRGDIDNGDACSGFCSSFPALAMVKIPAPETALVQQVEDTPFCSVCKLVVPFLKHYLESNATETEAKAALEKLCDSAGSLKNECVSVVDTYFGMIWKLLESYVDDDTICSEIKLCSNSTYTLQEQPKTNVKSGVFCLICEFVMKELDSLLVTNATEAEIKAALDKVCSLLPSSVQTDCNAFVDKYSQEIIEAIVDGAGPKVVCSLLKLCIFSQQSVVLAVEDTEISCETCTIAIGTAKILVKEDEKPIEDALELVCSLMASTIRAECNAFVEKYTPQIIQLVDNEIDPKAVCKALKICESALLKPWTKLPRARLY